MSIKLENFVDVTILHHETLTASHKRDTTVLFVDSSFTMKDVSDTNFVFTSLEDFTSRVASATSLSWYAYVQKYFANGGIKLFIQNVENTAIAITAAVRALPNDYIVIAYTGTQSTLESVAASYVQYATSNQVKYSIESKVFISYVTATTADSTPLLVRKYVTNASYGSDVMTIAAYLSKIDIEGIETVHDYDFTLENVESVLDDNTTFETLQENNINVDIYLAGAVRNIGGNTCDGHDLVNEYMLICLHQTLTNAVLQALTTKVKGNSGLSVIKTYMIQELNKYVTNGYLATDKLWKFDTMSVSYNGGTYTIIEKNTPLLAGFKIVILPYNSLNETDIQNKKTPPIYVIIADAYGIRKVTINGEVF